MPMKPHTRQTLDAKFPNLPDTIAAAELGLQLVPMCHRTAGLRIFYIRARGIIALDCAECGDHVCDVQVADQDAVDIPEYVPDSGPVQ